MSELGPSIRRAARRLRIVALAATLLVEALILFAAWLLVAGRRADFAAVRVDDGGLAPWIAAPLLILVGLLVGLALLRLVRMLGRVEAGAPFAAAADLRGFALYLFLAVATSVLLPPVIQTAMAAVAGGPHGIRFNLGLGEGLMLLVTGLLFFVARLLDAAQALADEHSQIV